MVANPASRGSLEWLGPASKWAAVTPSDSVNLTVDCRSVYIGGDGDISLVGTDGVAVTFVGVVAGQILPCGARRINVTGTTATNIVALY